MEPARKRMAGVVVCGEEFCSDKPTTLKLKARWPSWSRGYKIWDEHGALAFTARWSGGFSWAKLVLENSKSNPVLSLCPMHGTWVAFQGLQQIFTVRHLPSKPNSLAVYFTKYPPTNLQISRLEDSPSDFWISEDGQLLTEAKSIGEESRQIFVPAGFDAAFLAAAVVIMEEEGHCPRIMTSVHTEICRSHSNIESDSSEESGPGCNMWPHARMDGYHRLSLDGIERESSSSTFCAR